jgi:phosphomannomutase
MDVSFIGSSYDVRAVYPTDIDEDWFRAFGRAVARHFAASRVSVGWDARVSSPSLSAALIDGLLSQGADVVSLGLVATDMCHWSSVRYSDVDLAIMVTASHNPGRYNGVKICRQGGVPVNHKEHAAELKGLMLSLPEGTSASRGTLESRDILADWIEHAASFAQGNTPLRPLRIVADAGNGVAGVFLPAIAEHLGLDVEPMYFEPDGNFPNHPANPLDPETLTDLIARVRESGADLGVAFDGDADRAVIVDERGRIFSGTQMTAIIAGIVLARHPGSAVICNTLLGDDARDSIRAAGGEIVEEYVGHVYIKQRMRATPSAFFAGEHSGHYYFRENRNIDSGLLAMLVFLRFLSDSGKKASEIWDEFHTRESIPETNFEVRDIRTTIEAVAAHYPELRKTVGDGITLRADDWWCNIRPSSNEPLLRLNIEARDQKLLEEKFEELSGRIRAHAQD